MPVSLETKDLWEKISLKREEMHKALNQDGATTDRVLTISQELDQLLNQYDKLVRNEK